ncbi:MAG: hypothetical protein ACT4QD_22030 [Acidobacteriota bacterium]
MMEIDGDYRWNLVRDDRSPFSPGDVVTLPRVQIEILAVSARGRPTRVAFRFDRRLEDESIAWFGHSNSTFMSGFPIGGHYPSWTPPPAGRSVLVN